MKAKFALLTAVCLLSVCSQLSALQRHVLIYDPNEDREVQPKMKTNLPDDGDIHVIDIKLINYKYKLTDALREKLLVTAGPHEGIWVMEKSDNLPDGVAVRWYYIAADGTDLKAKNRPTFGDKVKLDPAEEMMNTANTAYDVGNYQAAAAIYVKCYNDFPEHRVAPFAMYMAGQCLSAMQKYKESIALLKIVAAKFGGENVGYRSLYRIACLLSGQLKKPEEGMAIFQALIQNPGVPAELKKYCVSNLAALNMIDNKVKEATALYGVLIQEYAGSDCAKAAKKNIMGIAAAMVESSDNDKKDK